MSQVAGVSAHLGPSHEYEHIPSGTRQNIWVQVSAAMRVRLPRSQYSRAPLIGNIKHIPSVTPENLGTGASGLVGQVTEVSVLSGPPHRYEHIPSVTAGFVPTFLVDSDENPHGYHQYGEEFCTAGFLPTFFSGF